MEKKSINYEFGGPLCVFLVMILLPSTIYFLYFSCNGSYCVNVNYENISDLPYQIYLVYSKEDLFTLNAIYLVVSWILFQALLAVLLPGKIVDGTPLVKTKQRLKYKINGHLCFWATLTILFFGAVSGVISLSLLYDQFLPLATAAILVSTVLSSALYVASFRDSVILTEHANSPSAICNFFMGRELNPRLGQLFDLKYFCELRPGLLGWVVLNSGMMAKQLELHGHVTLPMALVNLFQGLYVWDALYNEKSILTTMDITKDGFGFMLAFGDLAWVPFIYTLQSRYLVENSPTLSHVAIGTIVILNLAGYAIFRLSNSEKDLFRSGTANHDDGKWKYLTVKTKTGSSKLLISGWWGKARKINYTGDWVMGLAWCALCGFGSVVPYFYAIYFAILLAHRAWRDDIMCSQKYGPDWVRYKKIVPYLFIPHLI